VPAQVDGGGGRGVEGRYRQSGPPSLREDSSQGIIGHVQPLQRREHQAGLVAAPLGRQRAAELVAGQVELLQAVKGAQCAPRGWQGACHTEGLVISSAISRMTGMTIGPTY